MISRTCSKGLTNELEQADQGGTRPAVYAAPRTALPLPGDLSMAGKKSANGSAKSTSPASGAKNATRKALPKSADGTILLSGGNPQIAKGYGDAPVQKYIAAMPGWKSDVGKQLDKLVVKAVPEVEKAVKWNSPFYGTEKDLWFLGFHCLTKYVKVAFFRGAQLNPAPPGNSKQKDVRYLDIHENDEIDEAQFIDWVKQASQLPGERM